MDAPPSCSYGNTKAITAVEAAGASAVIRGWSGVHFASNPTLPATEQWVGELLPDFAGVAITPEDET